jgi:hypothetical protein
VVLEGGGGFRKNQLVSGNLTLSHAALHSLAHTSTSLPINHVTHSACGSAKTMMAALRALNSFPPPLALRGCVCTLHSSFLSSHLHLSTLCHLSPSSPPSHLTAPSSLRHLSRVWQGAGPAADAGAQRSAAAPAPVLHPASPALHAHQHGHQLRAAAGGLGRGTLWKIPFHPRAGGSPGLACASMPTGPPSWRFTGYHCRGCGCWSRLWIRSSMSTRSRSSWWRFRSSRPLPKVAPTSGRPLTDLRPMPHRRVVFALDNVTLHLDGVLYVRISDPYKASYGGVASPPPPLPSAFSIGLLGGPPDFPFSTQGWRTRSMRSASLPKPPCGPRWVRVEACRSSCSGHLADACVFFSPADRQADAGRGVPRTSNAEHRHCRYGASPLAVPSAAFGVV